MVLRILVADDHPVVRRGIKNLLEQTFEASIGEASTIKEAIEAVRRAPWDIVLLDLSMPGATGLEGLIRMARTCPNVPILVLSMHPEKHFAMRALRSGAAGYLTKDYSEKTLLKAVRQVLAGRRYVSSSLAERLVSDLVGDADRPPHDTLSKQEYRVMCLIASGKTVSQIAEELCLSVKTVSTYRVRILDKMQMQNNAELTRYCIANGLC